MNIVQDLQSLNFHDATLKSVHIQLGQGSNRSAKVELVYYDWEGNSARRTTSPEAPWQTKQLHVRFGFLAHIEFSAPDLVNRAQDIDCAEVGYKLELFESRHADFKHQFPKGHYPLFDGASEVVSLRLETQNNDENSTGYLWVVGSDVKLEWGPPDLSHGQTHLPLRHA